MKKENLNLRNLKRNGSITFTTDGSELKQLLEECKERKLKVSIRRFPSFVSVVLN